MSIRTTALIGLAAAGFAASPASAALIHAYEFSGGTSAIDSAGSDNGMLNETASISGGFLHLNGAGDSVGFATKLVPLSGAYSVFIRVDGMPAANHTEIIAQGATGGEGFYIGTDPDGKFRLTDVFTSTSVVYPTGLHEFLLTTAPGNTSFYVDGALVFSSATGAAHGNNGGQFSNTTFGKQFSPYAEFFKGDIDAIRIYDTDILPGDVVEPGGVPEPASWALLIAGFGLTGTALRRRRLLPA